MLTALSSPYCIRLQQTTAYGLIRMPRAHRGFRRSIILDRSRRDSILQSTRTRQHRENTFDLVLQLHLSTQLYACILIFSICSDRVPGSCSHASVSPSSSSIEHRHSVSCCRRLSITRHTPLLAKLRARSDHCGISHFGYVAVSCRCRTNRGGFNITASIRSVYL